MSLVRSACYGYVVSSYYYLTRRANFCTPPPVLCSSVIMPGLLLRSFCSRFSLVTGGKSPSNSLNSIYSRLRRSQVASRSWATFHNYLVKSFDSATFALFTSSDVYRLQNLVTFSTH